MEECQLALSREEEEDTLGHTLAREHEREKVEKREEEEGG